MSEKKSALNTARCCSTLRVEWFDLEIRILITVQVYDRLVVIGQNFPIGGNKGGSYLTGWSLGSLEINLINVSALRFCCYPQQVARTQQQVAITQSVKSAAGLKGTLELLSIGLLVHWYVVVTDVQVACR